MTVGEHIAAIRLLINKYDDDSKYTDEAIFHFLKSAAAIYNQRKADRFEKISDFDHKPFCLGLEKGNIIDCGDCVDVGCDVLRTKVQIPSPLTSRNRDLIKVYTFDYTEINKIRGNVKTKNYDPVFQSELLYDIVNDYIIIYNGNTNSVKPRAIIVEGVWEDITDWSGITLCDSEGDDTGNICFQIKEDDFPIHAEYVLLAYSEVLKLLQVPLSMPEVSSVQTNLNHPG